MRIIATAIASIWLFALVTIGLALVMSGRLANGPGLVSVALAAAPGVLLLRWGMGTMRARPAPNPLAPKAPYDRAAEAGHVRRINSAP